MSRLVRSCSEVGTDLRAVRPRLGFVSEWSGSVRVLSGSSTPACAGRAIAVGFQA